MGTVMNCKFCEKECKNDNSLRNHQRLCKLNPERQTTPFQDKDKQKEIAKIRGSKNQWSDPNYKMSDDTRKKLSKTTKERNANESEETKAKRKATIAKKVENGEWHVSLAKDHHYNYKGVDLHGKWELKYAKWLDENQIRWQRCKDSFSYYYEGKTRRYTPDFYLIDTDEYVEIKGYKTEKDEAKWSQFPEYRTLIVLLEDDLKAMNVIQNPVWGKKEFTMKKYILVIDEDDFGEFFYYLDPKKVQISPNFNDKSEAVSWFVENYDISYYGVERRKKDSESGNRRVTDIRLRAK